MGLFRRRLGDLSKFEKKVYSQNGEDGVIQAIFDRIGTINKYFVEYGVEDGSECNTRLLLEKGWSGLMMDGNPGDNELDIKKEHITAENINELFDKYKVPNELDLLSIDIDGNDYWVWQATKGYQPRVVVIEYNASIPVGDSKTVKYEPDLVWMGTNYFGASLSALQKLGTSKGYRLVYCDKAGVNAFFIQTVIAERFFEHRSTEEIFRSAKYGSKVNGEWAGFPDDTREMIDV